MAHTEIKQALTGWQIALVALLLVIVAGLCITFFTLLPTEGTWLGVDNISYALRPWGATYETSEDTGFKNPPWTALLLMIPANLLEGKAFWGLIVFCTLLAQILCVPAEGQLWRRVLAILLLMTCFPSLRNIADANLEFMVIGGTLLLIAGYRRQQPLLLALGGLLVTAKPQSISLLLVVLAFYLVRTLPWQKLLQASLVAAVLVVPAMIWRGREWLGAVNNYYLMNTPIDMSLDATLRRFGILDPIILYAALGLLVIATLAVCWYSRYEFGREKAGLLVTASILTAPYVGANAPVNIIAIGVIPLLMSNLWLGLILFALVNLPFLWSVEQLYHQSNYWTILALIIWAILAFRSVKATNRLKSTPAAQS